MKKVVIIGAGISGLAAGWYHKQQGHAVTILEKSARAGGWIRSSREQGFLFEQGPRGFRPAGKGKRTLALVKELGLESELVPADASARKRFIVHKERLHAVSFRFLLRQGVVSALLRDFCVSASDKEDETIANFCRRRFNAKIAERIVDPLVKGIFGGDAEELSMRCCFPTVWEAAKKGAVIRNLKKSKEKPPASLYSFRSGMERLTERLADALKEEIHLNAPVTRLEEIEADQIIAAIPAYALAEMAGIQDPFTYASLTTVSLGWNGSFLPQKGFGFLVPSLEKENFLGMTWDSAIFPEQNQGEQTRVCVMIESEGTLEIALEAVKKYLGIEQSPDAHVVGKAARAIPQYLLGHHKRLAFFQKQLPIQLIGNSYTGVGVNDCIEAAWKSVSS
ncbi:MAG: Protoporphyrinogen oxidase [Chlamydiales bacterium]|nr:Protoporphyrinogen oxidase [Chlamydiales bacterium]